MEPVGNVTMARDSGPVQTEPNILRLDGYETDGTVFDEVDFDEVDSDGGRSTGTEKGALLSRGPEPISKGILPSCPSECLRQAYHACIMDVKRAPTMLSPQLWVLLRRPRGRRHWVGPNMGRQFRRHLQRRSSQLAALECGRFPCQSP